MLYLIISFIWAQPIEAPSAKELCLQDTVALKQLMEANNCQWGDLGKNSKKKSPACNAILSCAVIDAGPQYLLCLDNQTAKTGQVSKEDIEGIYAIEIAICNSDETHRTRCTYAPGRADGAPVGDVSEDYCRVRTKKLVPAGALQ